MKVKLEDLKIGKNWSRVFGVGDIQELAESMQEHGQITPVLIDESNNLIAGFRRVAAAQQLGWYEIDANIHDGDNGKVINLIENMNREDLTLWEEIQAIRDVFGTETSQGEIARQLSKSRPWVEPRVKIWELPQDFIDRVRLGVAGVKEIKNRLRGRTKTNNSPGRGRPNQEELKDVITQLMQQNRNDEAKALSYALGAIKREELLGNSTDC
jgi:ParB family chromosome partitioning protein